MWFALTKPPYGTSMPQSGRRPQHHSHNVEMKDAVSPYFVLVLPRYRNAVGQLRVPTVNQLPLCQAESPPFHLADARRRHDLHDRPGGAEVNGSSTASAPVENRSVIAVGKMHSPSPVA